MKKISLAMQRSLSVRVNYHKGLYFIALSAFLILWIFFLFHTVDPCPVPPKFNFRQHSAGGEIKYLKCAIPNNLRHNTRRLLDVAIRSNRIGESCSKEDIVVYQGATTPMPNGIPTYTVQILNVCVSGCAISGIHLNCGWFSSARMINPKVFKRLKYNDCLVNDGKPLKSGGSISFEYANTFRYPLSVSSVTCS